MWKQRETVKGDSRITMQSLSEVKDFNSFSGATDHIQSHILWALLLTLKHQVEKLTTLMTGLYPGHERPQFRELASKGIGINGLELIINCT